MSAANFPGAVPVPQRSSIPISVLITGASRGIGLELTRQYAAANPSNTVYAGVRDVQSAHILALAKEFSNVHVIQLDTEKDESIKAAAEAVTKLATHGLDVLVNNAGIFGVPGSPLTTTRANLLHVTSVNVGGPLVVTQAFTPLLLKAANFGSAFGAPRVVFIGSGLGSNALAPGFVKAFGGPNNISPAYQISKASLNYLNTLFAITVPEVIFISTHPGWVRTDMAGEKAAVDVKDAAQGLRALTESRTSEHSGQYVDNIFNQGWQTIPY